MVLPPQVGILPVPISKGVTGEDKQICPSLVKVVFENELLTIYLKTVQPHLTVESDPGSAASERQLFRD